MTLISIVLLGLAMATDAFAAALGKGAGMVRPRWSEALRIGLIFGVVEALTPVIGWILGSAAARYIEAWDHWIAFGLLVVLGIAMIRKSTLPDADERTPVARHSFWVLAITAFATSIDAMAVGVSLAFIENNIFITAAAIGLATTLMVTCGVMLGRVIGLVVGKWAEIIGGCALIGIGSGILYEHLYLL